MNNGKRLFFLLFILAFIWKLEYDDERAILSFSPTMGKVKSYFYTSHFSNILTQNPCLGSLDCYINGSNYGCFFFQFNRRGENLLRCWSINRISYVASYNINFVYRKINYSFSYFEIQMSHWSFSFYLLYVTNQTQCAALMDLFS